MIRRAVQIRRGTVSVEFALVIASVVGVLLISASLLGSRVRHSLQTTAAFNGSAAEATLDAEAQRTLPAIVEPPAPATVSAVSAWIVLGQTIAMLTIIAWVLLERRKRLGQLDAENGVAEPIFTEDKGGHVFAKRQQIFKVLSRDWDVLLGSQIEVRHLMSNRVSSVQPQMPTASTRTRHSPGGTAGSGCSRYTRLSGAM